MKLLVAHTLLLLLGMAIQAQFGCLAMPEPNVNVSVNIYFIDNRQDGSFNKTHNNDTKPKIPTTTTAASSTTAPAVCPEDEGFIKVPDSGNQCFKLFRNSHQNWDASKLKCQENGLIIAKPINPVAVRKFLVEKYGNDQIWIGGRGNGSAMIWDQDGTVLSKSSSSWMDDTPCVYYDDSDYISSYYVNGARCSLSTGYCLLINALDHLMKEQPTQPYYPSHCGIKLRVLCEYTTQKNSSNTTEASQTTTPAVCPEDEGFIKVPDSGNQCFKLFRDSYQTWDASRLKCQQHGLIIAKPINPVVVRKTLFEKYEQMDHIWDHIWIGGQGNGTAMIWDRDGTILSNSSSFWRDDMPCETYDENHMMVAIYGATVNTTVCTLSIFKCLHLKAPYTIPEQPTQPYSMETCNSGRRVLCELL